MVGEWRVETEKEIVDYREVLKWSQCLASWGSSGLSCKVQDLHC